MTADTDILQGFSQLWRATAPPPVTRGAPAPTDPHVLLAAARRARARYPGPVGELVAQEIHAYARIGRRFAGPTLLGRVVADLLEDDQAVTRSP